MLACISGDLHLECSLQRVLVNVVDDVGAGGGAVGPQPVPQRLAVQVGGDGQTWGWILEYYLNPCHDCVCILRGRDPQRAAAWVSSPRGA